MDRDRLLGEEESGWVRLRAGFALVPPGRFEEPSLPPDGWSVKDVMYHVGAWLEECARVLERIREGSFDPSEPEVDVQEQNRAWFEISRAMDPVGVRAFFEGARRKARERFATLPTITPDAWTWFEESGPLHYAKHADDLSGIARRIG
jgi:hypothetical protein